jgi:hypothetical protein
MEPHAQGATVDSQLLTQGHVFENPSAVSARENDQEPNNVDDPGDHRFSITVSAHMAEARRMRHRLGLANHSVPEGVVSLCSAGQASSIRTRRDESSATTPSTDSMTLQ